MYSLKDNGVITEVVSGNNFEYLLADANDFAGTEYKVLQSQKNDIFVPCMKMARNGKVALYYVTNDYRAVSSIVSQMPEDMAISLMVNLFASMLEVKGNGFLSCQCLDLCWDKVFVESSTLKVKLVYLPLNVKAYETVMEVENEVRAAIIKLVTTTFATPSENLVKFAVDLRDGSMSLEEIYRKWSKGAAGAPPALGHPSAAQKKDVAKGGSEFIKLVALNAPGHVEIVIDSANVLIGKKQELVDKAVTFNNMISRKHCRVVNQNGQFFISDEGSANGTFVNGVRLAPGQHAPIKSGDIVRMADSDFQVV